MPSVCLFTIASKNYLSYARTLLSSVAHIHPEYKLYLCLADRVDGFFDPSLEVFEIIEANNIGIVNFVDMTIRYNIMELNTAVKPYMFKWIFENTNADCAIYLDPDIKLFSRLTQVENLINEGAAIVLTPHICSPLEDDKIPNDYNMLQAGIFNLGFMAAKKCDDASQFIEWWGRKLKTQGVADFANNLFTDQKWCDLAPCYVDRLEILKDPGFNVAYWNLAHRFVTCNEEGVWLANETPLVFFHFSGVNVEEPETLSKHQNRYDFVNLPKLRPFFDAYRIDLLNENWTDTHLWPYAYSDVGDGIKMCPIINQLYRDIYPEPLNVEFSMIGGVIIKLCNDVEPAVQNIAGAPPITRLMYYIYNKRQDLRVAFNLCQQEGQIAFASWFSESAEREYRIPKMCVPLFPASSLPLTGDNINELILSDKPDIRNYNAFAYKLLIKLDKIILHKIWLKLPSRYRAPLKNVWDRLIIWSLRVAPDNAHPFVPEPNATSYALPNRLSCPAEIPQLSPNVYITKLMYLIWTERPDLQMAFDLRVVAGQESFITWYSSAAEREYGISPYLMRKVDGAAPDLQINQEKVSGKKGANLIGYANAELGMGEHVRMTAAAFHNAKLPFNVINFNEGVASRQKAKLDHGRLSDDNPHIVNIFHINADQMLRAYCSLGDRVFARKYNIGYWAWELAKCPDVWLPVMDMVDEIWAPSKFVQEAFASSTNMPVVYMPLCVVLPKYGQLGKLYYGLPPDYFVFLYTFDSYSYFARKNPFDAVRAFHIAFPNRATKVMLVLKTMNGDEGSDHWSGLINQIDDDPRIIIINRTMDRSEVLGLFEAADCFISLHRSEGFGRGPAEAMYMGKPVIVTNYSGNTDFTHEDNSCLVDYQLVPVHEGEYPFHQGQVWAQPDVEHAAWHMKRVYQDAQYRELIGAQASAYMRSNYDPHTIGGIYSDRLRTLGFLN